MSHPDLPHPVAAPPPDPGHASLATPDRHSIKVIYGPTGSGRSTEAGRIGAEEARVVFPREIRQTVDAFELLGSVGWNPVVCEIHARDEAGARDRLARMFLDTVAEMLPPATRETFVRGPAALEPEEAADRFAGIRIADGRVRALGAALLGAWRRADLDFVPAPLLRGRAPAGSV